MDSTPLHTYNVAEEFSIFYSEHEAGQHAIPQDEMAEDYSVSEIIQDQAHYTGKAIGVIWTEDEYDILSRTDKAVEASRSLMNSTLDGCSLSTHGENHAIDELIREFVNEEAMDCQPSRLPQINAYDYVMDPKSQPRYYYESSPAPFFPTRDYLASIDAVVPPSSGHNSPHFPTWEDLWILYSPSLVPVIENQLDHASREHRLSLWVQLPSIKREKRWYDKLWKAACSVDFCNTDRVRSRFPNASRQAWLAIWWARRQVGGPECEENLPCKVDVQEISQGGPFRCLVLIDGEQCPATYQTSSLRFEHMERHYKGRFICPGICQKVWYHSAAELDAHRTQELEKREPNQRSCAEHYRNDVDYEVFRTPRWKNTPVALAAPGPEDLDIPFITV